jgi:hypothetical protein
VKLKSGGVALLATTMPVSVTARHFYSVQGPPSRNALKRPIVSHMRKGKVNIHTYRRIFSTFSVPVMGWAQV